MYLLVIYQLAQVSIILLQDRLGLRFFVPKGRWFPELDAWDYHPILPPRDLESGTTVGDGSKIGKEKNNEVDCVICFEKIELASVGRTSIDMRTAEKGDNSPISAASAGVGEVFGGVQRGVSRMSYMVSILLPAKTPKYPLVLKRLWTLLQVPPCHHIAHTECLESWAAIKMEW